VGQEDQHHSTEPQELATPGITDSSSSWGRAGWGLSSHPCAPLDCTLNPWECGVGNLERQYLGVVPYGSVEITSCLIPGREPQTQGEDAFPSGLGVTRGKGSACDLPASPWRSPHLDRACPCRPKREGGQPASSGVEPCPRRQEGISWPSDTIIGF
jgi:hypothetical protein